MNVRKNTLFTMLLGASLAASAGCPGNRRDMIEDQAEKVRFKLIGVVEKTPANIDVTTMAGERKLCAIAYKYDKGEADYKILVGPDSRVTFDKNTSYIILEQGWVYLWGKYPRVRRGRVSAGAEGSALAMSCGVENGLPVTRVFFIEGWYGWWQLDDGNQNLMLQKDHYMEFINDDPGELKHAIGSPVEDLYKEICESAGIASL